MSKIEKRYNGSLCTLNYYNYNRSLETVLNLVQEARKDFPLLENKDFNIQILSGNRRKSMLSIEFYIPEDSEVPESYFRCELEPIS